MACDVRSTGIILEPMYLSWGKRNTTCVTPTGAAGVSDHFLISSLLTDYYVWYDTTGADPDPAVAGRTGLQVDVSADNTVSGIITATTAVLETSEFWVTTSSDGLSMKIENKNVGAPLSVSADGDTTWTIATDIAGVGGDLGKTEDVEVAIDQEFLEILASQTGAIKLDEILTSISATVSTELLEMSVAQWELIVGEGLGGKYTPGAGTQVVGYGTGSLNRSSFDRAGELVMHPVSRATSDKSRDITLPLTLPKLESVNFSGTERQAGAVSFESLIDDSKNANINLFVFGDSSQDLRV